MAKWCNPLTLQPEQSGGQGSITGRVPPLERHDKGCRLDYVFLTSAIPVLGPKNRNFTT